MRRVKLFCAVWCFVKLLNLVSLVGYAKVFPTPLPTPLPSALSTLTVILFIDRPRQFRLLLFWFIEYMAREREILSRFIGQSVSSHPLCSTEVNKISLSDPYIWCFTVLDFLDSTFSFNHRYVYICWFLS